MSTTIHKQILVGTLSIFTGPDKWLKHNLSDGKGAFCLIGGVAHSAERLGVLYEPSGEFSKIYLKACRILENQICATQPHSCIVQFNNAKETTFEDVRAVLHEAIQTVDT